jgi:peptidoglycan/LPS O-acetylase OafA/YrhL
MSRAPTSSISYRADIDGLRALAVVAVIGFHAFPPFVPGGYAGVDIFFVISGFLISSILLADLETGEFSFSTFYFRRARRLLPALAVVLAACLAIGWFVLVQTEFQSLQKYTVAGATFLTNFMLWRDTGYFDAPAEAKPLLHLWSLGVEEQFYLLWPAVIAYAWKRGLNILTTVMVLAGVSFAMNLLAVTHQSAAAAFYLPHTRLWELLIGASLTCVARFHSKQVDALVVRAVFREPDRGSKQTIKNALSWLGLALILVAFVGLARDHTSPNWWAGVTYLREVILALGLGDGSSYPGIAALAPTLGAACLIAAGPTGWVNRRLLSIRAVVYIGLISYPLYLWHWPLLSFVRITESGAPSRFLRVSAIATALGLAITTYHVIERRARRLITRPQIGSFLVLATPTVLVGAVALFGSSTGDISARVPNFAIAMDVGTPLPRADPACKARFSTLSGDCDLYGGDSQITTALLGDSHAAHFLPAVGAALALRKENVVHFGQSGCPPLLGIRRLSNDGQNACDAVVDDIVRYVANDRTLRRVLLAFRHSAYLRDGVATYRLAGADSAEESMKRALEDTVAFLADHHKDVWIVLDVPQLDFNITECAGRPFSFEHRTVRNPCGVATSAVFAQQAEYRAMVQAVQHRFPAVHVFDPLYWLCDDQLCYAAKGNQVFFVDDNHLSRSGSLLFADKFAFQ